jgi:cytochrome d ubiquinol oxidase subunit II
MLETIWFVLWGVLWAIYFMLDGFDLGVGMLMPFVAKTEAEKRTVYGSIGPFWDGNEVWLVTAGGVTFAAFPAVYAVMFSSFYTPLMLILFALILRAVSMELRGKVRTGFSRKLFDICLTVGSFLPALLFGVAFANIFKGIPIDGEGIFHGTIFTLLNPYCLMGGVLFVSLFLLHGALWLNVRLDGEVQKRGGNISRGMWMLTLLFAVVFLVLTAFNTDLFHIYLKNPLFFLILVVAVGSLLLTRVYIARASWWKAWFSSSLTIVGVVLFGVVGLYPNLLPSSLDAAHSLTVHNSSSSPLALKIMLVVVLLTVPVIILYQVWAYKIFSGKVTKDDLHYDEEYE